MPTNDEHNFLNRLAMTSVTAELTPAEFGAIATFWFAFEKGRTLLGLGTEWIAELLRFGLLKPSFVPERWQRELRELTRYRTKLVGERASELNCIQKLLEGANIKYPCSVTSRS